MSCSPLLLLVSYFLLCLGRTAAGNAAVKNHEGGNCDAMIFAVGTATGIPPPREDVATAAEVAAAPDEDMGGMPPPRGAADAAGAAAGKPPPREDVAAANEVDVAGTTAGVPPPREDVAEVVAAPDENMGGIPPPRGAADASGVAAGKPTPREDVAAANGVGAAGTAAEIPPPRAHVDPAGRPHSLYSRVCSCLAARFYYCYLTFYYVWAEPWLIMLLSKIMGGGGIVMP